MIIPVLLITSAMAYHQAKGQVCFSAAKSIAAMFLVTRTIVHNVVTSVNKENDAAMELAPMCSSMMEATVASVTTSVHPGYLVTMVFVGMLEI